LHFVLYLTGLVGSGVYFLYLLPWFFALCFAILLTFLYSAPKLPWPMFRQLQKIAVGKTFFLACVWVYVTTVLPLIIQGAQWQPSFVLFIASRFFFTYALCIIFDYRDRKADRMQGIKTLITQLDDKGIDRLFWASIVLFFLTSFALARYHYPAFYIFLLVIPGLIVASIYRETKRNSSDYLYYIVLDGLMMFSGLLMLIFRI
jgi:4-hydroxybenzoate polyprenyltransferase